MTNRTIVSIAGAAVAVALIGATVSACSNKATQQWNDAPRTDTQNAAPAEVIAMPDGFSNLASKCDGPDRVYVVFHNDNPYGSVAVVPNDTRCTSSSPTPAH